MFLEKRKAGREGGRIEEIEGDLSVLLIYIG